MLEGFELESVMTCFERQKGQLNVDVGQEGGGTMLLGLGGVLANGTKWWTRAVLTGTKGIPKKRTHPLFPQRGPDVVFHEQPKLVQHLDENSLHHLTKVYDAIFKVWEVGLSSYPKENAKTVSAHRLEDILTPEFWGDFAREHLGVGLGALWTRSLTHNIAFARPVEAIVYGWSSKAALRKRHVAAVVFFPPR